MGKKKEWEGEPMSVGPFREDFPIRPPQHSFSFSFSRAGLGAQGPLCLVLSFHSIQPSSFTHPYLSFLFNWWKKNVGWNRKYWHHTLHLLYCRQWILLSYYLYVNCRQVKNVFVWCRPVNLSLTSGTSMWALAKEWWMVPDVLTTNSWQVPSPPSSFLTTIVTRWIRGHLFILSTYRTANPEMWQVVGKE